MHPQFTGKDGPLKNTPIKLNLFKIHWLAALVFCPCVFLQACGSDAPNDMAPVREQAPERTAVEQAGSQQRQVTPPSSGDPASPEAVALVIAIVDKSLYAAGEDIAVTLRNDSDESILSHAAGRPAVAAIKHIQKKTGPNAWQNFFAQCQPPHCYIDVDAPTEIKPGQSASFAWKPLIYVDGTEKTAPLEPGEYRLEILFEDAKMTEWKSVFTNEFTVK